MEGAIERVNDAAGAIANRGQELLSRLQEVNALAELQNADVLSAIADEQLRTLLLDQQTLALLVNDAFLARIHDADLVAYLQSEVFVLKLVQFSQAIHLMEQIQSVSPMDVLVMSLPVFVIAFLVTLIATPIFRHLALRMNVVDRPSEARKIHTRVTPYFGGLAIFTGMLIALLYSTSITDQWPAGYRSIPIGVFVGMFAIAVAGLFDDMTNFASRFKVALILVAAAALAQSDVGTRVAAGLFDWMELEFLNDLFIQQLPNWSVANLIGAVIIGIFVLGGCNATNLIDGLDGLLSGVTGIIALGLLALSLAMLDFMRLIDVQLLQVSMGSGDPVTDGITLAGVRIVLSLALLGSVLGFLPYNFNPAKIFLGDCGSLLLGYMCVVIILMLGEVGQTELMLAGLIIFSIPIIDTILAIVRRRVQGKSFWTPDAKHMHHIFKQRMGSVKRAVLCIYAMGMFFAIMGAGLGVLNLMGVLQNRFIYIAFILLVATAIWIGWRMGKSELIEHDA